MIKASSNFIATEAAIKAMMGTQLVATFIAVYGLFMAPIGWNWALLVWGYALVWFFLNDRVKLATYRVVNLRQPGLLVRKSKRWAICCDELFRESVLRKE